MQARPPSPPVLAACSTCTGLENGAFRDLQRRLSRSEALDQFRPCLAAYTRGVRPGGVLPHEAGVAVPDPLRAIPRNLQRHT